jgi:hypothetical protein
MKRKSIAVRVFALCLLSAASIAAARADITYTQETQMPGGAGKMVMLTQAKKGAERVETTMQIATFERKTVQLTVCAKKTTYQIDPALKLYTAAPIGGEAASDKPTGAAASKPGAVTAGAGKIISTVSVKDLGAETLNGYKTRHYRIVQRIQTSGCAGNTDTTLQQEVWVAPTISLGDGCPEMSSSSSVSAGFSKPGCKCAFVQQGDVAAYTEAMKGLRVRTIMFDGVGEKAKPTMTMDVKNVSQAKLEDTLFAIPSDYKEVSAEEFAAAQQKAMMNALTQQKG